jgi:hypothetical protein
METLGGFPYLPALWLRWAKPISAYANMETLGGFLPFGDVGPAPPAFPSRVLSHPA